MRWQSLGGTLLLASPVMAMKCDGCGQLSADWKMTQAQSRTWERTSSRPIQSRYWESLVNVMAAMVDGVSLELDSIQARWWRSIRR